jgi:predicted HTH transcriptional regulator
VRVKVRARTLTINVITTEEEIRIKKEFFKDVSSFANASGGYLLIGVDEEKESFN